MLDTLRTEKTTVRLSIAGSEESNVKSPARHIYLVQNNAIVSLRAEVTNNSCESLSFSNFFTNDLTAPVASAMVLSLDILVEPYEHVIHEGSLSDIPLESVEPGASAVIEVPICFVSCGRFYVTADVRVWGLIGEESKVGLNSLRVEVRET
jgi:trafficking protein particle complex subunit 9